MKNIEKMSGRPTKAKKCLQTRFLQNVICFSRKMFTEVRNLKKNGKGKMFSYPTSRKIRSMDRPA